VALGSQICREGGGSETACRYTRRGDRDGGINVEGLCSVDRVGDAKVALYPHRDDPPVLREVIDDMICETMEESHE
jgi:hypothetical protein